jgi:molybdopterin/thiamine biosynthesis adenylyltransferase
MTTVDLRVPGDLQTRLLADITGAQEWAGYLLCGVSRIGEREVLLGQEWVPVPARHQIANTGHGFSWHPDFDIEMLNRIQNESLSGVVLHYHGGTSPALGMNSDRQTARSLMPFLSSEAPGRPHIFGVLGEHAGSGAVFRDGDEIGELAGLRISGSWLDDWSVGRSGHNLAVTARQDRMVRGFGEDAFRRLRLAKVGIVGCGGGGSHVVQQLAYLGIGSLVVIDADSVEETNLNRLIGAVPARSHRSLIDRVLRRGVGDVGLPKVDVMKRLVDSVDDTITVETFRTHFPTRETVEALRQCDLVIACVDKLQVRDDLNRLCKRYLIPLLDVGLEITPGTTGSGSVRSIPGRMTKVLADGPCLRCQGVISDAKLLAERDGQPMGYTGAARVPDPAVVTLNGIVASIAATEVLQLLTGFAGADAPNCGWMYDGLRGDTERVEKAFRGCSACTAERGRGDV